MHSCALHLPLCSNIHSLHGDIIGKAIIGATLSLYGFMNDRNGDIRRLYPDLDALAQTEMLGEAWE